MMVYKTLVCGNKFKLVEFKTRNSRREKRAFRKQIVVFLIMSHWITSRSMG